MKGIDAILRSYFTVHQTDLIFFFLWFTMGFLMSVFKLI